MADQIKLTARVNTTDSNEPLALIVRLDNNIIFENPQVTGACEISYDINDDEGEHVLQFELQGKKESHTVVNDAGEIVKDVMLTIRELTIEGVDISRLIDEQAVYTHNFNGTGESVKDRFYGDLGCNGTVEFKFSTPFYLWLLENM